MPPRAGTSQGRFRPKKRDLFMEMPQLRKKYEGGIWGYGKRVGSQCSQSTATNNTKILLSSQAKKSQHEFSFSNLHHNQEVSNQITMNQQQKMGTHN